MSKKRVKIPEHYQAPLRSRQAIAEYLLACKHYEGEGRSLFAFNVKLRQIEFTFDSLLQIWIEAEDCPQLHDPDWLDHARSVFEKVDQENLFEYGRNAACHFVTDTDCYKHLPDGTEVDVTLGFMGRSDGYIGIFKFEGYDFTKSSLEFWKEAFCGCPFREDSRAGQGWLERYEEMPFDTLYKLYRYVVMCEYDFDDKQVVGEIMFQIAQHFFKDHREIAL